MAATRSPQFVDLLRRRPAELRGRILIASDRLSSLRWRRVTTLVDEKRPLLRLHYQPAYVPDLNSIDDLWDYAEHHRLANLCART